ncbi:MAG TPA: BTAD domain-containing putative transcriptional regulator [Methylomirabilota bacterium]|nr:BTAD domain-containing putative transcriptional regulator [Methylomirabilota bacterium]
MESTAMDSWSLMLLGGFGLRLADGASADLPAQKDRALLAILAMATGDAQSRERIAGLLWSEHGDRQARDSLKQALVRLRRCLGGTESVVLRTDRQSIALDKSLIDVDVLAFERLVRQATLPSLAQAAALYRGDLLEGIAIRDPAFEDWLLVERQRLRQLFERALAGLMSQALAAGDRERAAEAARRLLQTDPLSEAAYRTLMQVHADEGQTAQAIKLYKAFRDRLYSEMGVQPEPATKALCEGIRERRLVAASSAEPAPVAEAPAAAPESPPAAAKPSIAVLPFTNMGGDPDQEYFADGLTEEIITELSQASGLSVVARHTVFALKGRTLHLQQVARDLNVDYLLEGSVRKSGGCLRVTAQLIDGASGDHRWADRYDRRVEDVFALQDEISRTIVDVLKVTLLPGELETLARHRTANVQAYEYYLMGRSFYLRGMDKRCLGIARGMYAKAAELDPDYARAYAGLAICDSYVAASGPSGSFESALANSARALALEPDLAEAHAAKGLALYAAIRFDEAAVEFERAMTLDPRLFEAHFFQARNRRNQGRRAEAAALFARAAEMRPNDFRSLGLFAWECKVLGRHEEFSAALRRCLTRIETEIRAHPDNADALAFGSSVLVAMGEPARAEDWASRAIMLGAEDDIVQYNVALAYAMLGKVEAALDHLDRAFAASATYRRRLAAWLKCDGEMDALREHPRFRSLLDAVETGASVAAPAEPAAASASKPSVAVLPFVNLCGESDQQYFSDGVTEDLITELSRFRTLLVTARNSSFRYRGGDLDLIRVGRELGVRYLCEGSVRRIGERVRIGAQLIEAATGCHLWAENFDREVRDILAVQDDIVRAITTTLGYRVESAERERALRLSPEALTAYDLTLRSEALIARQVKADNAEARQLASRAIALDPKSASAHVQLGWAYCLDNVFGWTDDMQATIETALALAQRAVLLDESDCRARWLLGYVHIFRREYDEAGAHLRTAITLNPNDVEARVTYGFYLNAIGEPDAALEQFDIISWRNPFDFNWMVLCRAIALFTARRYAEAVAALKRLHNPNSEVHLWLAASQAGAGCLADARASLDAFLAIAERDMVRFPGPRLEDWRPHLHRFIEYRDPPALEHLATSLQAAGLR